MNAWLRRYARWLGVALMVLLAGGTAYALRRDAGSGPGGPGQGIVQARAIAPVLAPAAQRRTARFASRSAVSASATGASTAAARSNRVRPGVPTAAASRRAESLALRQATGLTPAQVSARPVCPRPTVGHATCAAQVLVLRSTGAPVRPHVTAYRSLGRVKPATSGAQPATSVAAANPPQADTPAYFQQAYDLAALSQNAGAGDTVAVVDGYDDPSAASDLSVFRSTYSLPACSTSPCFRKVTQTGGTSSYPVANGGWDQEISLDLDAVSSVCPKCHILLVEANSDSFSDLETAMKEAANLGANQISASWWGISNGVPAGFRTFSGIATVAATGDAGYPGAGEDNYPAALPGVTAAGGTSLAPAAAPSARGFGESAWSWNGQDGGGSGCDVQFTRPTYQPAEGCDGRAYADLSADADPNTGLNVYENGWHLIGGTSLSTPLVAAYYAVTGVAGATPAWAYADSSALNDITNGSTGLCATSIAYICNAGTGYDGPTGVGSISGSVAVGAPGIGGPSISSSSGSGNTYTASVSAHGATISAGIYRNGLDTTWSIQYGTTASYGSQTAPIDIGAGAAPVSVTGYLSQLTPGTQYHYRLVAQNSSGTTYGYDYTLTSQPAPAGAPVAAFAASPSTASPDTPVSFDASASTPGIGSISDYSWNFGDGTTFDAQTSKTTEHTYATRGTYTVTLTITSNGQTDTSTQTVTIDAPPSPSFTVSARAVPDAATVAFDGSTSTAGAGGGSIIDYSWNFGDGSVAQDTGQGLHASHKFMTPGTYTVTLTTTDDLDVSSTTTRQITVAPFKVTQAALSSTVTFTAVNPPTGSTLSWDFGDRTAPGSGSSVTHTYSALGAYSVTLTIQNGSTSTPYTATVIVDTPPTPAFTPSPTVVRPGATVSFDGSASSAPSGSITDYTWDFGDGSAAQDTGGVATTTHAFPTPGVYMVTLTTTDDLGTTVSSKPQQVTVDEPAAAFSSSQTGTAPDANVTFDASSTSDPESSINDYSWNFGDGTGGDAGANATESHTYTSPGTYTVSLTVTNQLGLTDTTTGQVVIAPASVQSTGGPTPVTPPVTTTPNPSPPTGTKPPSPLALKLTAAARQRLAVAVARGFRLVVTVNQPVRASFRITIPLAETRQAGSARHGTKRSRNATVVLLTTSRTFAAGGHAVVLKLPRAAARKLASTGRLVLTVRVTVKTSAGKTLTRTQRITLTR